VRGQNDAPAGDIIFPDAPAAPVPSRGDEGGTKPRGAVGKTVIER
jgi:hypothetical protein